MEMASSSCWRPAQIQMPEEMCETPLLRVVLIMPAVAPARQGYSWSSLIRVMPWVIL